MKRLLRKLRLLTLPFGMMAFHSVFAQTPVVIEIDNHTALGGNLVGSPLGFNLNAQTRPSWQNPTFRANVVGLHPGIIRYPGGTISQYWDWQSGRALPPNAWSGQGGTLLNHAALGTTPMVPFPLSEFRSMLLQTHSKPVLVLNVLSRSLADQMDFLRAASAAGVQVSFVELGNEFYLSLPDFVNRFPTAGDYAREMNIWTDSIKAAFPNARIAVIGATTRPTAPNGSPMPDRIRYWNDSIYAHYNYRDAMSLHLYFQHQQTGAPTAESVMAHAFQGWEDARQWGVEAIDSNMQVWITEYNLSDSLNGYQVASSWMHALFTTVLTLKMRTSPRVEMLLNHQITGAAPFASLASYTDFGDTIANVFTAEGVAMRTINNTNTDFTNAFEQCPTHPTPMVGPVGMQHPGLLVYKALTMGFGTVAFRYILVNASDQPYKTVFTSSNFPDLFSLDGYTISSDSVLKLRIGEADLIQQPQLGFRLMEDTLLIPPYGITYLSFGYSISTKDIAPRPEQYWNIYPNPVQELLTVTTEWVQSGPVTYEILDLFGKRHSSGQLYSLPEQVNVSGLPAGSYRILLRNKLAENILHFIKQ
jgi:hypothetical protein